MSVFQVAMPTGSYPTLGAGYLAKTVTVTTTNNPAQYGWWRFANIPFSTLTAINGTSSYSAILLVNSVNPSGIYDTNAIQSGFIELDLRLDGGKPTNINTNDVMKVLCGSLYPNLFCCNVSDTEIEFYVYLNGAYNRRNFTVLNEVYYNGEHIDALEFESTFVSSSAPANAVYAVVRNIASYVEVAKSAETLSRGVELDSGSGETGWYKFMEASGLATGHGYSAIILVNGVLHTQESTSLNVEESGIIEVDYYNKDGVATRYGVSILAGNLVPEEFCITASGNSISVYKNLAYAYEKAKFTELSLSGTNATTTYGSELESAAPANAVYAVVRNIASYAESIPVASQTVIGGAKMWVSNGKLYIKTT